MECHDAKLLVTFAQRKCEALDASERAALDQHVGACPDCIAFANAERQTDAAFGKVMLDVPVPADLQQKVLKRLAEQRLSVDWKWLSIAAAVLIAASAMGVWYRMQPNDVSVDDLIDFVGSVEPFMGMPQADVEKYFEGEGIHVKAPDEFEYDFLRHAEVIEFRNKRIAKLSFRRALNNGVTAQAYVLILPHGQFRAEQLPSGQLNDVTTIEIKHAGEFTYVIYHRGNLATLRRVNIAA